MNVNEVEELVLRLFLKFYILILSVLLYKIEIGGGKI